MPEKYGGVTPLIRMQGICKGFPGVKALRNVDFELLPGEIHMLLGENGAGKSTLIKILSGAYIADEGSIEIAGEQVDITSPHAAIERGVRSIYQEINLVQELDIARNLFLGEGLSQTFSYRPGPQGDGWKSQCHPAEDG